MNPNSTSTKRQMLYMKQRTASKEITLQKPLRKCKQTNQNQTCVKGQVPLLKNVTRNLSLTDLLNQKNTRNLGKKAYHIGSLSKNVMKTYQELDKPRFGNTLVNRAKNKELGMYIEKATRMVRELSRSKPNSEHNSICRNQDASGDEGSEV